MSGIVGSQPPHSASVTAEQGAAFSAAVIHWFKRSGRKFPWRRRRGNLYRLLLAEILLKKTAARAVPKIYDEILDKYPTAHQMATAEIGDLWPLLQPVGLKRQRALQLRKMGERLSKAGQIGEWTDADLLKVPGVGPYTSAAVQAVKWGRPKVGVDTNVVRVISRVFGTVGSRSEERKSPEFRIVADVLGQSAGRRSAFLNWGLIDLGALVCLPHRPLCEECPVQTVCSFFEERAE